MSTADYDAWAATAFPPAPPSPTAADPCPFSSNGQHDWAPETDRDGRDIGDACTCCGVPR